MIEKLTSRKSRIATGLAAGSLMVGAYSPNASPDIQTISSKNTYLVSSKERARVLRLGDNITETRMLSPAAGRDTSVRLRPTQRKGSEDLGLIYDPKESEALVSVMGEPKLGDGVGFLVESDSGTVFLKIVYFSAKSGTVNLISPGVKLKNKTQPVFEYVDPGDDSKTYTAYVDPTDDKNGDVVVSFKHPHPTTKA